MDLKYWQDKYEKAKSSYGSVLGLMDDRESLYAGTREIDRSANAKTAPTKKASHVRNIVFELIESQIDSTIPLPKVTTLEQNFTGLAKKIEDSLKTDLLRLPFKRMNDEQERTTPIQGGSYFLVEWDNSVRTHDTIGDLSVSLVHPKNVIPQAGLYDLESCDHVFVRMERTRDYIKRRYGIDVGAATETEKGIGTTGEAPPSDDKVVQVLCYYKNDDGGIGLFSWVDDEVVEDLEDYQARQLEKCVKCGKEKPFDDVVCECGGKNFERGEQGTEVLASDVYTATLVIPEGTEIPYYKPNRFPLVLRKNVSTFGKLLGGSDIDVIRDQQMTVNKLGSKIEEKLLKGGSLVTFPKGARFKKSDEDFKVLEVNNPQDVDAIRTFTLQPNTTYDSLERERAYQDAKSTLGITDTFQGKPDPTAESGVAKQALIQQATGRLDSKRQMKDAAYRELYRLMFMFKLAYTDEPRPYTAYGANGEKEYGTFSRYDFLEMDAAGEYYYNDQFLFDTDPAGALGQNRQRMWEETRRNFAEGTFGNPQDPRTLLLFWQIMESLAYPMAGAIKSSVEGALQEQQMMMQMQQMQQPVQVEQPAPQEIPNDTDAALDELMAAVMT